jgi:glutamate-1-semialdehyde 2,1-aminomutase
LSEGVESALQVAADDWGRFPEGRGHSAALYERGSTALVSGVNHNLRYTEPFPLYFARGEGPIKWDVDGNEYVDYQLGSAALLLGHQPFDFDGLTGIPSAPHENEVVWGEQVTSMVPSADKVRFVASGTEATLLALRLVRAYTGKTKVLRFHGHYHGWHDYSMFGFRAPYDSFASDGVPDVIADTMVATEESFEDVEAALATGEVAAVFVEPSGASYGTVPLAPGLLEFLRRVTSEHGVLLVFDEMITGFRYAPGGIQERDGVVPDVTTLGKILTGGLPGGAVAGKAEVLDVLRPRRPSEEPYAFHFGTFNAHPLSAAVGIATLREVATGEPGAVADAEAAALRSALDELLDAVGVRGFAYGESSIFHVYLAPAGQPDVDGVPDRATFMSMPAGLIDLLHRELRVRGVDLMSYNGGVLSAAHGPREREITLKAFEEVLHLLKSSGLVAAQ